MFTVYVRTVRFPSFPLPCLPETLTPHGPLVLLLLVVVVAVDDHGSQVGLQHGAAVLDHGLRAVAHGAGGSHGPGAFRARLDHGVGVHLGLLLLGDARHSNRPRPLGTDDRPPPPSQLTYGVVVLLLQLPLLLLLPLGLHLHGLGDQVPQDGDRFGLADERVLEREEGGDAVSA